MEIVTKIFSLKYWVSKTKPKTMKFTDMNFDCLETVLEYLELIDLLNVADSTKRLNKAAQLVFARKHKNQTVEISREFWGDGLFGIINKEIYIRDLKTILQLLRCFGPVISKICFVTSDAENNLSEINQKVVTYINKYCADYLEELEIDKYRSDASDLLKYFDRPFPKVTTFRSTGTVFTENVCLNRLFPKMRCLFIWHKYNISFYNYNTKHFPYLERLLISEDTYRESFLRNEMVINLLQLNPQLKKLDVHSWEQVCILNTDLIRSAVDSLQNIESLTLCLKPITFHDDSDNIIEMKSVKFFRIDFNMHNIDGSSYLLPFLFENLDTFFINLPPTQFVNGSFIDQFFNFIDIHSSIKNLKFSNIESFDVVNWSRLAKSLPLLLEIEIFDYISADEAIEIMVKFEMLKKIWFRFYDDNDSFRKCLGNNWKGTYETEEKIVKLHRKI